MAKIAVITGSRADYGLLEPLIFELIKHFDIDIVATGAHVADNTWKDIDKRLWNKTILVPIVLACDNPIGVTKSMGLGLFSAPDTFANIQPDCVLVLGDRYEIFSFCIGAYNLGIPIAHIQNSDITLGSLDDGYRKCISTLATYHFPVDKFGSLGCIFPDVEPNYSYDYLCVYHPYKGDYKKDFIEILDALKDKNVLYICSNRDAGGQWITNTIKDYGLPYFISLPRKEYIAILKGVKAIIGNSSSGLIEAPSLKTPTINIGKRQEGRLCAESVVHIEPIRKQIEEALKNIKNISDEKFNNPYYRPKTVEQIVKEFQRNLVGIR